MKLNSLIIVLIFSSLTIQAQPDRWQQRIKYNIDVLMNVTNNKLTGTEKIEYTNNSPDTLHKIFFHLYWNAFKPNSSMDIRSRELGKTVIRKDKDGRNVLDWDGRVTNRISTLTENEIGYQQVKSITINGKKQQLIEHETILEVILDNPILPKSKQNLVVVFEAQVPKQIRRSGRDNTEGIKFSMSQWYPKMVEYDYNGWNANPYIAREFYGIWGDFDVNITIDKNYMVAATGELQNALKIGMGYTVAGYKPPKITTPTITWNFKANNVHDFVWAADTDYTHVTKKVRNNLTLHLFYKSTTPYNDSAWNNILWAAEKALPYIEKRFGKYPYPQYSFIQGGDGGMEYAMATLIRGYGLGTVFHEWMHSWYQQILGFNESLYPWMDEGFTSYAEEEVMAWYNENYAWKSPWISQKQKEAILYANENMKDELPLNQNANYYGYFNLVKSPYEEPLTTHADHYNTNRGYGLSVYAKGGVYLNQLGYIVSDSLRDKILLAFYDVWKFKHPNANDFLRIAEKVSGISLHWYNEYWINSIKSIDYAVGNINIDTTTSHAVITLKRIDKMPMPIDVLITYKDGSSEVHYIPLDIMFGNKPAENKIARTVHTAWKWTHPEYHLSINRKINEIKSIEIDPTQRMADINRANNKLVIPD